MSKKVIVVIVNGLGASGKSTFCNYCCQVGQSFKYKKIIKGVELSTVDYVKQIAYECGWDGAKTQRDRVFLAELKGALARWNNSPINKVFESIERISHDLSSSNKILVCFVNSREPEDHAIIRNKCQELGYPCAAMLVENPTKDRESNEVPELIDKIKSCKYEIVITNDGTLDDLKEKAVLFMEDIIEAHTNDVDIEEV